MDNRKFIFVGLIGLIFIFAGYNLYSYFKEQQAIQIEEDRLAQERKAQRERDRAERDATQAAERQRLEDERQARAAAQAQEEAERQAQRDQERLEAEAKARVEREAREQAQREADQARLEERIARARSREQIEDFSPEVISQIRTLSPRYLEANPNEALQVHTVPENGFVYPELRPCFRTLGYFTPVHERGTEWDNIDGTIRTSIRQQRLNGFMNLARHRAALPRSLGSRVHS